MYFGLLCFYTYFQEKEVSKCVYRCIHGTNLFHFHRIVKLTSPTLNCVLLLGLAIFVLGPLHYPSTSAIAHSIRCVVRMK